MAIKSILVVEDDMSTRTMLEHRLEQQGYEVTSAADGHTAVAVVPEMFPNLILMDIILTDMDGPEAVRLIKKDPRAGGIPVIFVSSMISDDDPGQRKVVVDGTSYQAIPKPIDFDQLWEAIRQLQK